MNKPPYNTLERNSLTQSGGAGGASGFTVGLLPVDAPLGVDPQDSRVFSIVVLHLGVGELGTVDVDNNRGAARSLPRWCQASDLS